MISETQGQLSPIREAHRTSRPGAEKANYSNSCYRYRLDRCRFAACLLVLLTIGVLVPCPQASAADPYAKAVVLSNILNGNVGNSHSNPAMALGPPDTTGTSSAGYVSLGGPGGSLMVDMGVDTPVFDGPGADLEVREIGAAFGGSDESYRVLVSNSTDTNTFVLVGQGRALSLIDIHVAGLASARYVWLQDLATETLNTSVPGSDIDSLRVIYYSGSSNDVAPPSALGARLTGQGLWLSWMASTATNLTGYAIRRSLDGLSFGSTPDATLSPQETAWHDVSPPAVGDFYYAVSAIAGTSESVLVTVGVHVPMTCLALFTNQAVHLGDDTRAAWEDSSPQPDLDVSFALPNFAVGPQAELTLDLFEVDYTENHILLNGAKVAVLPTQTAQEWVSGSVRFAAGALQPGLNLLTLSARNSSGGTTGGLDDFQVRNLSLRLFGTETNMDIISCTRFTQVATGQTNVTFRWVVEQTPSLAPVDWQTVSGPIEWTGTLVPTNGFFRLRDAP